MADDLGLTEPSEHRAERSWWAAYKAGLEADAEVAAEVGEALRQLNIRYDTAIWENRFIVGGICEQIIGASARAVGAEIDNAAKAFTGVDLRLPGGGGLSVKAVFAKGFTSVRLINTLGSAGGRRRWVEATVFVIRQVGIGYADPGLLEDRTDFTGDAVELRATWLKTLWAERPDLLTTAVDVPRKPDTLRNPRAASDLLSHDLLSGFSRLRMHWRPELE